jgi:hypothetical protein
MLDDLFSDHPVFQLDRMQGLMGFLRDEPSLLTIPTPDEYRLMSKPGRNAFNALRIDRLGSDLVVPTKQVRAAGTQVRQTILSNRGCSTGRSAVILSGEPGMGKTTALMAVARSMFNRFVKHFDDWEARDLVPVAYVSMPSGATGKTLMSQFAEFFGIPLTKSDRLTDIRSTVVSVMIEKRVQLVLIDELHRMGTTKFGQDASDVLKSLIDAVPATFVLAGFNIESAGVLSNDHGQIAGRASMLRMRPYTLSNADERKEWASLLISFEGALGLLNQPHESILELRKYIHDRTSGSIGALGKLLTLASQELIFNSTDPEHETLTQELLESIPLPEYSEVRYAATVQRQGAAARPRTSKQRDAATSTAA